MRIFLSYASEHKSAAEPIAFALRSRGHHVFLDRDDLPPGGSFDDKIQREIERSDIMIYLVSPASVAKGRYTRTELEFARAAWRHPANRVLPVMIEPTPISDVPSFLKGVTILEPQGNTTAEVAAATERLRGSELAAKYAWKGGSAVGLLAGLWLIAMLVFLFFPLGNTELFEHASSLSAFLTGVPFVFLSWKFGRMLGARSLVPLLSVPTAFFIVSLTVLKPNILGNQTSLELFESVSTYGLDSNVDSTAPAATDDTAANTAESVTDKEMDAAYARQSRLNALSAIERANDRARFINDVISLSLAGMIALLGAFAGVFLTTPEIRDMRRWLISATVAGLATATVAALLWQLLSTVFMGMAFLIELTLLAWFPITGAIIGYWIGRGRPS